MSRFGHKEMDSVTSVDNRRLRGLAPARALRKAVGPGLFLASLIGSMPLAAAPSFEASMVTAGEGNAALVHASKGTFIGSDIDGRGIVLVAAGAVHNDTDDDGILDAGESIDYDYTVLNVGRSTLTSLAVSDNFGGVTCPFTTLLPDTSMTCARSYVITASDDSNGLVSNEVVVAGQDAQSRPVSASDLILTRDLDGEAGIRVFKSPDVIDDVDGSNTVTAGDVLRYTFVVKNSNAETLSNVTLSEPDPSRIDTAILCDPLTIGGALFSGNGSGSLASNDVVICEADYTVRPADISAGEVRNLVDVSGVAPVAGTVTGTGASLVLIPNVNVTLAKTLAAGGPTADAGEVLTYAITLTATSSTGRTYAAGTIGETVPANTVNVVGDDFTCTGLAAGSTCSNTNPVTVPGGGSAVLTFRVQVVNPTPAGGGVITNTAIPPADVTCDSVEGCGESTTIRSQADLQVLKAGPAVIERGQQVTFSIRVGNVGPDTAANVSLADPTPTGLVFISTAGACTGPFPCALGNLGVNESRSLTATYLVPTDYAGPTDIINTVTATTDSLDPTPGDTSSSVTVAVISGDPGEPPMPEMIPTSADWSRLLLILSILGVVFVSARSRD